MRKSAGTAGVGAVLLLAGWLRAGTNLGNVVCIGDSITEGRAVGGGGYRQFLQSDLTALGYSWNFVGSQDSSPATYTGFSVGMTDPNHEGYGNFRIDETINGGTEVGVTAPPIGTLLTNDGNPNLVLLVLGTNDVVQNYNLLAAESQMSILINDILTDDPGCKIVVGSILPLNFSTGGYSASQYLADAQSFNNALATTVATDAAAGENVKFADIYSSLNPSQTTDGIHPTFAGYKQMAQVWAQAIGETSTYFNSTNVDFGPGKTWAPGSMILNASGSIGFEADAGANGENLSVCEPTGYVTFFTTQHLASLFIGDGALTTLETLNSSSPRTVVFTPSLLVNGTLNLTTNDLDVQGGDLPTITALVRSGLSGSNGITSSTATGDTAHVTTVGVLLNSVSGKALYGSGAALGSFDGSSPRLGDVLVKYTYYGDGNLDGKVDGSDYSLIDNGFLTHATGWFNGDFNYDGSVDGLDYTLIDNAFNHQGAALQAILSGPTAEITAQISSVPEPASVSLLGCALFIIMRPRNTRKADRNG